MPPECCWELQQRLCTRSIYGSPQPLSRSYCQQGKAGSTSRCWLIFIDLLWFKAQKVIFWVYFSVHPGHKLWRSVHGPVLLLLEAAACSKTLEREGTLLSPAFQPGTWSIVSAAQEANRRQRNKTFKLIWTLKKIYSPEYQSWCACGTVYSLSLAEIPLGKVFVCWLVIFEIKKGVSSHL